MMMMPPSPAVRGRTFYNNRRTGYPLVSTLFLLALALPTTTAFLLPLSQRPHQPLPLPTLVSRPPPTTTTVRLRSTPSHSPLLNPHPTTTTTSSLLPPPALLVAGLSIPPAAVTALSVNSGLALLGLLVKQKWLTPTGLLHAYILGVTLWTTLTWKGWSVCVAYLVFGSIVTKIGKKEKEALGIAEKRGGARGPENVWGSAAAGTICAIASVFLPKFKNLLKLGYICSLATKLSDTFGSEIGKAYGRRTFLITTLKPVPKGTEGAVSLEGTLAGVVGSLLMAGQGLALGMITPQGVGIAAVAAFVATNVESLLGATLQNDKHPWATNEVINFINTMIGAALGVALGFFFLP